MEDINVNSPDECGSKAGGMLCALRSLKCILAFGLDSIYLVVQKTHSSGKKRDLPAVSTAQALYRCQRQNDAFEGVGSERH